MQEESRRVCLCRFPGIFEFLIGNTAKNNEKIEIFTYFLMEQNKKVVNIHNKKLYFLYNYDKISTTLTVGDGVMSVRGECSCEKLG